MGAQLKIINDRQEWLDKRKSYVTSTESPSLFGLQMPSAATAYELWHIKRGLIDNNVTENERMIWGRRLEQVIAQGICEDYGFKLQPMKVFAHDDDDKIGSSFDNVILNNQDGNMHWPAGYKGAALLEIKTVAYRDYKEKFLEDSEKDEKGDPVFIEGPDYYEVQVQHELELINSVKATEDKYEYVCLAVFVMDTRDVKLLWRKRDREVGAKIRAKVREFWNSTEPPAPDLLKDSDLLARQHKANSTDSAYDATQDSEFEMYALAYIQEGEKEKAAKDAKSIAKSAMILKMGKNNTAWCNSARVSNKSKWTVTEIKGK